MHNRSLRYSFTIIAVLLLIIGFQPLFYPLGGDVSFRFVRTFGSDILERPVGVAVADAKIYVADTGNDRVVVFDRRGEMLGAGGRTGSEAGEFRRPMRLETGPDGNLYVADLLNDRIQVFSPRGNVIKTYGKNGDIRVSFHQPGGVDIDSEGNLYVVEFMGQRVRKIAPDGEPLATWGVKNEKGYFHYDYFNLPTDVAVTSDDQFYVSDTFNDRVKHYGPDGNRLNVWGGFFGFNTPGPFRGWFKGAYGLGVSNRTDRLFVTDWGNDRVQVFNRNGEFLATYGTRGSGPGEMKQPTDVAIGDDGTVYVVDYANDRIQVWEHRDQGPGS